MDSETKEFLKQMIQKIQAEMEKPDAIVLKDAIEKRPAFSNRVVDLDLGNGESVMVSLWGAKR